MSRAMRYVSLSAFAVVTLLFLIISCVSAPPNPYDPSNTKAYLTLESSSGLISADTLTDTVGNTIRVGITSNLPSDVDSIEISVYNSADGTTDIDTILKKLTPLQNQDTLWFKAAFTTSGKKTLTALVFAQGNNKNSTTAYISILDRPVKAAARAWPHISVSGTKNITTSQTCSLAVSVLDSNPAQAHTFYVKQDTQPQSEFIPPMFRWTPPTGFTGAFTVVFKVTDTDSPSYFDTQTVVITVSASITTPKWFHDTVSLTQPAGSIISLTLGDICSGDSLSFSLAAQPVLNGDTIISGVYSYTFAQGDTNTYWPKIIAKDKNGNADTMTLKIWATKPSASSAKALTAFSFASPAVTGTIIDSLKTVALTAPYGTDVTALVATFATTGASVKIGSVIQTSGTTVNSFSSPVTYTVVAADGSTQAYVVTVTIAASSAKALTAFSFTSPAVTGTITESAKTVALTVPYGTDVSALVATFTSTGASVKVGTTVQTSATTANNFTSPVTYTVVAADGSTQAYVVTVTVAANTAKALTAFSFTTPAVTGTITESAKTVALTVPYGTDVTALVATFTSTGASVKVGATVQTSATTANNFTNPVTYMVVAADGGTQNYVVTVTVAASSAKALTAFSFAGLGVNGTITESAKAVVLTVPYSTDVTALVATFTSTGASVKVGTTVQTSATTANNFTSPVTYTVVAADGSTQAYVVTVTVAANTAKALTAFSFAGLGVNGTITESAKTVALTVPYGTDITALVATFTSTGASVKVGTTVQTSATTANNFTSPVTYTVVAADGSTQAYVVTVTVAANTAITITTQPQSQAKCLGAPVSFSIVAATGSGSLSYQWKNAAGNLTEGHYVGTATASLSIGAVAATDTGAYTCLVTSTSGTKTTSAGAMLTVNTASSAPTSATAQTASICPGSFDTLTVSGGRLGTGAAWTWYAGGCGSGTAIGTGIKIGVSPSTTTTYYVRAEGGNCGSATSCVSCQVAVNSGSTAPTSATAQTASICPGSFDTLTLSGGTLGTGASWTWYAGSCGSGTAIGTGIKIGVSPSTTTTYYVRAEGGSCGSATSCVSCQVAVNSVSTAPTLAIASSSSSSICSGGSVAFTMSGGTLGTGANWAVYKGPSRLSTQPTITNNSFTISNITTAASYSVQAENGTCSNGSASNAISITLNQASTAPTLAVSGSTKICQGSSVTFKITGGNLGTGASWGVFDGSGNQLQTTQNNSFNLTGTLSNNSYYVKALSGTCDGNNSIVSNTVLISILTPPTITNPIGETATLGSTTYFSVTATGSSTLTYQWFRVNSTTVGLANSNSNTYKVSPVGVSDLGSYYCIVTDSCNNFATSGQATLKGQCSITYDANANGGTLSTPVPNDTTVDYGSNYQLNPSFYTYLLNADGSGSNFLGWGESPTETIPDYSIGYTFSGINRNYYLYAIWSSSSHE